jgi:hypothetical protein
MVGGYDVTSPNAPRGVIIDFKTFGHVRGEGNRPQVTCFLTTTMPDTPRVLLAYSGGLGEFFQAYRGRPN